MYIEATDSAAGPFWGPNFLEVGISTDGQPTTLQIFADINNDRLRQLNKPRYFYILPNRVYLAKDGIGRYMLDFIKFAGVLSADNNIGATGQEEVAGGVLSFSSTLELPPGVLDSVKDQITTMIKSDPSFKTHPLFQLPASQPQINLGFVPIDASEVAVSNLTMNDITSDPAKQQADDKWLWRMQGEGKGSIDPNGFNSNVAMVGQFPAALIASGLHGENTPIMVHNALKLRFRCKPIQIVVNANVSKIFENFSSNTKYKDDWNQINIQTVFQENSLSQYITVKMIFGDQEIDDKEKKAYMDIAQDAQNKMFDQIKSYIFDRQEPKVDPAVAADTHSRQLVKDYSLFWGLYNHYSEQDSDNGYSYAFKSNVDITQFNSTFTYTLEGPYSILTVASGTMSGLFNEIKAKPELEQAYIQFVNLGDAFKKIHVIATSRANWPDSNAAGDPLDKLTLSVGYTDSNGVIQYSNSGRYYDNLSKKLSAPNDTAPAIWTKDDKDRVFVFEFAVNENIAKDLQNKIFIKRTVAYKMDPRVKINDDNTVLIPEEPTTDTQIEVKANIVGHLIVGPLNLDVNLDQHTEIEVTFEKNGFDPTTWLFSAANINDKKVFELWTNENTTLISWTYKVKVTYKSFGLMPAITYEAAPTPMQGSYPNGIMLHIPPPPDNLIDQLKSYKAKEKELEALDA